MDYDRIETDFVERTLRLIREYRGPYEVTLLVNCCLGLLVLPKEKHYKSIPNRNIPINGTLWGLSRDSITADCQHCGYSLSDVVRRIRNGICHFKVKTVPDDSGKIDKIEIRDQGRFKVVLSVDALRELATSLAEHVINP